MDAIRRQVAGLIVEPEASPFPFDLPQIFRLVQQLLHPCVRITGILIEDATGGQRHRQGRSPQQQQFTDHTTLHVFGWRPLAERTADGSPATIHTVRLAHFPLSARTSPGLNRF